MDKGFTINVLDKGFVRYIDHFGSDERIVETARISYKSPSKGAEQDKKLLFYLYRNRHTSPFESCNLTFNIKMPIFVMRQFIRHRMFRVNEQSARYSEMSDDFYIPHSWRKQDDKNKQGSVQNCDWDKKPEPEIGCDDLTWNETFSNELFKICKKSYETYQFMLKQGVSKEMARMILPVNLYTEIYVNCDIHNLLHFLSLRMDEHSQWEIRQYANAMFEIMEQLYPFTAEAFSKYKFKIVEGKE